MVDSEKKQQPKLLIITGPQGSGNHLFAKIFSMHPSVEGWPMLRDEWQGHHEEPFADYWQEPKTLKDKVWERQYYVTSISCPYILDKKFASLVNKKTCLDIAKKINLSSYVKIVRVNTNGSRYIKELELLIITQVMKPHTLQ